MVEVTAHGGHCCGIQHIHGFGARHGGPNQTQANVRELLEVLNGRANHSPMLEINLSNMQVAEHPELLEAMAREGFVYCNAWTGNHGTPVHQFTRVRRRLSLQTEAARFNWQGMIATHDYHGQLPDRPGGNNNDRVIRIGDRVQVNSPASARHNRTFSVIRTGDTGFPNYTPCVYMRDVDGQEFRIVLDNLVKVVNNGAPQQQQEFRHPNQGNNGEGGRQPAPQPAANPDPILNEVFALFRDGRERGPFQYTREITEAYPRAQRYVRRRVFADGRIEREEGRIRR